MSAFPTIRRSRMAKHRRWPSGLGLTFGANIGAETLAERIAEYEKENANLRERAAAVGVEVADDATNEGIAEAIKLSELKAKAVSLGVEVAEDATVESLEEAIEAAE